MRRQGGILFSLLAVLLLVLLLLNHAAESAQTALSALRLAATVVVPSLFPFCVLSTFLVLSGMAARWGVLLRRPMEKVFRVDGGCAPAWILGVLCGYPIGASVLAGLYEDGEVSRESVERTLPYCSNASPGFIVSIAGGAMLGSLRAGWLLLLIHLAASLLVGLTMRPKRPRLAPAAEPSKQTALPFPTAFTEAVRRAALTMVQVSGFIVLFSVFLYLLQLAAEALHLGADGTLLFAGILELTNGLQSLHTYSAGISIRFVVAAAMLGWSGLCVHCQVLSLTLPKKISAGPYLAGKLLHGLYSVLLALPASRMIGEETVETVAAMTSMPIAGLIVLCFWLFLAEGLFLLALWKFGPGFGIMEKTDAGGG